jgi:GntR family transcriptional regulator
MDEPTKYREIAADMQGKIESAEWPPGSKLPSDAELGETYHVSRNTIREAVKLLTTRGLAEKRSASRGTFVPSRIDPFSTVVTVDTGFGGFEGAAYASEVTSRNREPTVTTPKVEILEPSDDIAGVLKLDKGSTVVIRHQWRLIDGELWSMQTSHYPMSFVTDGAVRLLEVKDIPDGVRRYLDAALGIKEIGSHDTMKVRPPDRTEADAFGIPDDGRVAVFETRQVGVNAEHKPVRVTISIYAADRNQFSMKTGKLAEEA